MKKNYLHYLHLGFFTLLEVVAINPALAEGIKGDFFDSDFLYQPAGQNHTDLSVFSFANRILPGNHVVWVYINKQNFGKYDIEFLETNSENDAIPCIDISLFETLGINRHAFPQLEQTPDNTCVQLNTLEDVSTSYDTSADILQISIPQAALLRKARGTVPQSLWDSGESVVWTSYSLSHMQNKQRHAGNTNKTTFLNLRSGINLGDWRLRSTGNYYKNNTNSEWNTDQSYLERDIVSLQSRLRIGDNRTSTTPFGSTRFRGALLTSANAMLPNSQQGYAPTVEGIASSSAEITIRQYGNVIYSTFVPPGPFKIDDLYATPGGGDLEVEIKESDGNIIRYTQPYAGLPMMVRQGQLNYSVLAGKYHSAYKDDDYEPALGQFDLAYGLPYGLTVYGNGAGSEKYYAGSVGIAANLQDFGGTAVDITHTSAKNYLNQDKSGQAIRMQYAKNFIETGTNFRLAGYKYQTEDFKTIDQAFYEAKQHNDQRHLNSKSYELLLSSSQSLGDYGFISGSYSKTGLHNKDKSLNNYNLSYSNNFKKINYQISLNNNQAYDEKSHRSVMLSLNIPLGSGSDNLSYYFTKTNDGQQSHDAGVSGSLNESNSLNYNLRAGIQKTHEVKQNNYYGALSYNHNFGNLSGSYAQDKLSSSYQVAASGAALADSKGILFSRPIHGAAIIVEAPAAKGVPLLNSHNITTNSSGRALIPNAIPYRENTVRLDPLYQSDMAVLIDNIATVVPTHDAIVLARFDTEVGQSKLVQLMYQDTPVPFGAAIFNNEDKEVGIIGPMGRAWVTGITEERVFSVQWENEHTMQCSFTVADESASITELTTNNLSTALCE